MTTPNSHLWVNLNYWLRPHRVPPPNVSCLERSTDTGKAPLPSLSVLDCVNLGLVKFRADEVHSVGSPLSAVKNQKLHIEASDTCQQLTTQMPETCLCIQNQYHHHVCLSPLSKHNAASRTCHNNLEVGSWSVSRCAYRAGTVWKAFFLWSRPQGNPSPWHHSPTAISTTCQNQRAVTWNRKRREDMPTVRTHSLVQ